MMQPTMNRALKWSIAVGLFLIAVIALLYVNYLFTVGTSGGVMSVEPSDGEPVATLDPERTYDNAPDLARALDEALATNESAVILRHDQERVDEIIDYMVEETGNYTDPFLWKGSVFRIEYVTP